jgi:hypothetical protein
VPAECGNKNPGTILRGSNGGTSGAAAAPRGEVAKVGGEKDRPGFSAFSSPFFFVSFGIRSPLHKGPRPWMQYNLLLWQSST